MVITGQDFSLQFLSLKQNSLKNYHYSWDSEFQNENYSREEADKNLTHWFHFNEPRLEGTTPKYQPFCNSESVPFESEKAQTIYWFSGRILSPKPLFALAVMTQVEEFEQCLCIVDSFPLRQSHLKTDMAAMKLGLFLHLPVSHTKVWTDSSSCLTFWQKNNDSGSGIYFCFNFYIFYNKWNTVL